MSCSAGGGRAPARPRLDRGRDRATFRLTVDATLAYISRLALEVAVREEKHYGLVAPFFVDSAHALIKRRLSGSQGGRREEGGNDCAAGSSRSGSFTMRLGVAWGVSIIGYRALPIVVIGDVVSKGLVVGLGLGLGMG